MKYNYVKVDISTIKGMRQAEKIQAKGYNKQPGGYNNFLIGHNKIMFEIPKTEQWKH
jgi:hypothetical protein